MYLHTDHQSIVLYNIDSDGRVVSRLCFNRSRVVGESGRRRDNVVYEGNGRGGYFPREKSWVLVFQTQSHFDCFVDARTEAMDRESMNRGIHEQGNGSFFLRDLTGLS